VVASEQVAQGDIQGEQVFPIMGYKPGMQDKQSTPSHVRH